MNVNLATDLRNEVTAWLNSKKKSLDQGLELMRKTGYKPHVYQIFLKNKNRHDIPSKVENQLRLFLRYYANPNNPIHQDEIHDFYQKNESEVKIQQLGFVEDKDFDLYPVQVKDCITQFRNLYTQRSKMHNELKNAGEGNTTKETGKRALLLAKMETISRRMDELWQAVDAWKANAYLPSEQLLAVKLDLNKIELPKQVEQKPAAPDFDLATDVDGLKKQSDNWRTKIVKAKNRLKYQSDTKKAKEDPMPAGPKRITLEKRITRLEEQKLIIDTALAQLK